MASRVLNAPSPFTTPPRHLGSRVRNTGVPLSPSLSNAEAHRLDSSRNRLQDLETAIKSPDLLPDLMGLPIETLLERLEEAERESVRLRADADRAFKASSRGSEAVQKLLTALKAADENLQEQQVEIIAQKQELQHAEEAAAALHTRAQLAEARCAVSKHEEQEMQNKLQKMREELERNEAALQATLAVLPDLKTQADTAKVALDAAMQKSVIHGDAGATPEERATMKQVLKQYKKAGFAFQKEESRADALKSLLAQRKLQMEKLQSEVNKLRAAVNKAVCERDAALAEAASAAAALEEARTAARNDSAARAEESPVLNSLLDEKENELQQLSLVVSGHKGMRQDLTDKSAAARECSSDLHAELLEVSAKLSGLVQRVKENDAKRDLSTQKLFDAVLPLPTGMPAVPTGSDLLSVFRQDSPAADVLAAMKHIVDNDIDCRGSLFTRLLADLSKESDPSKPGMKYRIAVLCTGPLVSGASRLPGEPSAALQVLNAFEALWPHLRDPALLRAWREARNVGLRASPTAKDLLSVALPDGLKMPGKHRLQVLVSYANCYYNIGRLEKAAKNKSDAAES